MKIELYNTIVKDIRSLKGLSRDCAYMLIQKYPYVPSNAIHGILSSEVQLSIKKNRGRLHSPRMNYLKIYREELKKQKIQHSGVILRMSIQFDLSPVLLARVILERYLQEKNPQIPRGEISKYMKDTTQIPDPYLAHEIYTCILYDDRNGMISDAFCNSVGYEYELTLENYLKEKDIPYLTEDKLRIRGYDKTPDVKLEIPIAVGGFIINWIESKGRFGTPAIHQTHVKEQFLSYWNRFGPGLVIYWFGYVDEIIDSSEKKFMVLDHFPDNITYMNPLIEMNNLTLDDDKS